MERGYTRPFQGGGSGIGFKPPGSIVYHEPQVFEGACTTLLTAARRNVRRARDDTEKRKALVWEDQLGQRLLELRTRRGMIANSRQPVNGNTENSNPDNCLPFLRETMAGNIDASALPNSNQTSNQERQLEHCNQDARIPGSSSGQSMHISCSVDKVIPGVPKSIDNVVSWWRFGCEKSFKTPLWKFKDKNFRIENGIKYQQWNSSGQRGCFERMMRLVEHVSLLCTPPIPCIYSDSSYEENYRWNTGIENFKELYSGFPLTKVDEMIRHNKKKEKEEPLVAVLTTYGYIQPEETLSREKLAEMFARNTALLEELRLNSTSSREAMVRALMKKLSNSTLSLVSRE